jgi:hypothetical protein
LPEPLRFRKRSAFGFCCGGFSSTPGYVPDNEVQTNLHGLLLKG